MKTVFVLFDSLNRHLLGAYGGNADSDAELRSARARRR